MIKNFEAKSEKFAIQNQKLKVPIFSLGSNFIIEDVSPFPGFLNPFSLPPPLTPACSLV